MKHLDRNMIRTSTKINEYILDIDTLNNQLALDCLTVLNAIHVEKKLGAADFARLDKTLTGIFETMRQKISQRSIAWNEYCSLTQRTP